MTAPAGKTALIIGASRGLGYALAAEYLKRGWLVTATVRGAQRTELHDLAGSSASRLVVETVDITVPEEVAARHQGDPHTLLLIAPGWVQTELGGSAAPLTIDDSIP